MGVDVMYRKNILIGIALMVMSSNAGAAFNWGLDSLTISGSDVPFFFDDFEDGDRHSPPTSSLIDGVGTTTESGGFLVLSDSDGFGLDPVNLLFPSDLVSYEFIIPDNGVGTTITASFRPDLPGLQEDVAASYGILISAGFNFFVIAAGRDEFGNTGVGVGADGIPVIDSALFASTSGNIVLELFADLGNDLVTGRYSIDGGLTFNNLDGGTGEIVPGPGTIIVFGQGPPVPIPAPIVLLGTALAALTFVRKKPVVPSSGYRVSD